MFSTLRTRFGIPGVISVIALVFAMFGGAYAASSHSGKATASAKAKKGPRGPRGATGPAGPVGPAGVAGLAGPQGLKGDPGEPGVPGKNGINGKDGKEGSPWVDGGTLPEGSTETGTWTTGFVEGKEFAQVLASPISFTVPLEAPLGEGEVFYISTLLQENKIGSAPGELCEGEAPGPGLEACEGILKAKQEACPGGAKTPLAAKGNLCLYQGTTLIPGPDEGGEEEFRVVKIVPTSGPLTNDSGASTAGASVIALYTGAATEKALLQGTWAVTAP